MIMPNRSSNCQHINAERSNMANKKIYAVRQGRKTGLFSTWAECQKQVTGFSGAEYKSFTSMEDAKAFLEVGTGTGMSGADFFADKELADGRTAGHENRKQGAEMQPIGDYREYLREPGTAVAYVDGSYDKVSGDFSCGVVFLYQGQEEHYSRRYSDRELSAMRNVAGEIKGSETAMGIALEKGVSRLVIYHDYEGIAKWCNGAWKANKEGTRAYQAYYQEIRSRMPIVFVKVKGHSGDRYNDVADMLAKKALAE